MPTQLVVLLRAEVEATLGLPDADIVRRCNASHQRDRMEVIIDHPRTAQYAAAHFLQ
jgi:hypothetical protein